MGAETPIGFNVKCPVLLSEFGKNCDVSITLVDRHGGANSIFTTFCSERAEEYRNETTNAKCIYISIS
jgi:hypothetical protein